MLAPVLVSGDGIKSGTRMGGIVLHHGAHPWLRARGVIDKVSSSASVPLAIGRGVITSEVKHRALDHIPPFLPE